MKKIGYFYAVIAAILFGSAGLFVKLAYKTGLDSISLLTFQYIIAVAIMFIMAIVSNVNMLKVTKKDMCHLAVLGVVGNTFMTVFYYMAFEYLPVAMVTLMLYTYPLMVFLYSLLFKKEKITIRKTLALFFAFAGCLLTLDLISGKAYYSIVGILLGILSAVFYAFMNIYSEKKLYDIEALAINAYSTMFSLICLIIYRFPMFIFTGNISYESFKYTLILAIFCEIIPLTLLYAAIKHIGSLKVSIISNLEIPTAMLLSSFILREHITILQVIGAALVIYAIYLIREKSVQL